jgi:hypothetical protein
LQGFTNAQEAGRAYTVAENKKKGNTLRAYLYAQKQGKNKETPCGYTFMPRKQDRIKKGIFYESEKL